MSIRQMSRSSSASRHPSTTPPDSWTVATYVNTDLWGAYVSTPATAGTWYAWVEGTDGSRQTVYPVAFAVT